MGRFGQGDLGVDRVGAAPDRVQALEERTVPVAAFDQLGIEVGDADRFGARRRPGRQLGEIDRRDQGLCGHDRALRMPGPDRAAGGTGNVRAGVDAHRPAVLAVGSLDHDLEFHRAIRRNHQTAPGPRVLRRCRNPPGQRPGQRGRRTPYRPAGRYRRPRGRRATGGWPGRAGRTGRRCRPRPPPRPRPPVRGRAPTARPPPGPRRPAGPGPASTGTGRRRRWAARRVGWGVGGGVGSR